MKGLRLFIKDWLHIGRHKQARVAVAILLVIPLLYAGMFLEGYWDPYGNLDKLPVAVVNLDEGAEMDGEPLRLGEDLVADLRGNQTLDFHMVDRSEADQGLKDGTYDLQVVIPGDFSRNVTTLTGDQPQTAKLIYKENQGDNFIAGQIGDSAMNKLEDEVGDQITQSYTRAVFSRFGQISAALSAAGSGAAALHDGSGQTEAGFQSLRQGIGKLAEGAGALSGGLAELKAGQTRLGKSLTALRSGAASLTEGLSGLSGAHKELQEGAAGLSGGSGKLAEGLEASARGAALMAADADRLADQLNELLAARPELKDDAAVQQLSETAGKLAAEAKAADAGQDKLAESAGTLASGQKRLEAGLGQYAVQFAKAESGSRSLSDGLKQYGQGQSQWNAGFDQASGGFLSLVTGIRRLQEGSAPLSEGLQQLSEGSGELAGKLGEAAQQTAVKTTGRMLGMFSRPVELVEEKVNEVPNYGTAMAPYFLTLGLFVGGLVASNIIPFSRKSNAGLPGFQHFVNKYMLFLSIALVQTAIVDAVLLFGFKLEVLSLPKFLLLSLAASAAYSGCMFMLVALLGSLGRLAGIFLLVAQLASSGGTFPLEMSSPFIQTLSKGLPMTYAVEAFRNVISTGDWTGYWHHIGTLCLYLAAFALVSLAVIIPANRKERRVQPAEPAA